MVVDLGKERATGVKEILTTVAFALGCSPTKKALGLNFDDYRKIHDYVAEEMFTLRSAQIKLREAIGALIEKTRIDGKRVVFFIDDLDRCLPSHMLKMLEALKLYLNVKECVYFLGLDHTIVRRGIEKEYADLKIEDQDYLDKIIQLPFAIPPIHGEKARPFIESLLPTKAKSSAPDLAPFLGNNPRKVKRFVNTLALNLMLASEIFREEVYSIDIIVKLLLIQHRNEGLFRQIGAKPGLFLELTKEKQDAEPMQEHFAGDSQLKDLVQRIEIPLETRSSVTCTWPTWQGRRRKKDQSAAVDLVCVMTDASDRQLAEQIQKILKDEKTEFISIWFGDFTPYNRELRENALRDCDGVIIIYGQAKDSWVERQLLECRKSQAFRDRPFAALGIFQGPPPDQPGTKPPINAYLDGLESYDCRGTPNDSGIIERQVHAFLARLRTRIQPIAA